MPHDVRMPDGTIIRNVPDGTTKADLQRRYAQVQAKGPDNRPTSFLQGFGEELAKMGNNAGYAINRYLNPVTAIAQNLSDLTGYGKDYTPQAAYQATRKANAQASARSKYQGSTAGRIAGGVVGTLPTMFLPGGILAQGALQGAMASDNFDDVARTARDAAVGAGSGYLGGQVGKRIIAPVAERVGRTAPARAVAKAAVQGANALVSQLPQRVASKVPALSTLPLPSISAGEKSITRQVPDIAAVQQNLADAARLNLPYALADASPELRALAGSVTRKSPNAYGLAERTLEPRAAGQADRATDAIDRYLAPITDLEARAKDLRAQGSEMAAPYYQEAFAQPAPSSEELRAMLGTPAGKDALSRAYEIAGNEMRDPRELGFIVDDSGAVGLNDILSMGDGRVPVAAPKPVEELSRQTVRTWGGAEVPKRGPIDLVGWLRLNGGLADQGGELGHMGLSNAMRPGVGLKGQENRFGPILNNDSGMNFDDAAMRAWEAGYFPEFANERPDVNTFLNALRDTYEGRAQRFLPQDQAEVERFLAAADDKANIDRMRSEGDKIYSDRASTAGQFDYENPPMSAYGEKEMQLPTMETLDLVKRGIDARLNEAKDAFGNIDFTGNPQLRSIEGLRQRLVGELDAANPDYRQAREVYARYGKRAEALKQGEKLASNSLPQRQFDRALEKANAYDSTQFPPDVHDVVPEIRRGYATSMADAANRARLTSNPYQAIYGSTNQQTRVGQLFPEGAQDFGRVYGLERDMAKTATETLGGSATARRSAFDDNFGNLGPVADMAVTAVTGGKMGVAKALLQKAADARTLGIGQARADAIAPSLFNTDPAAAQSFIESLMQKNLEMATRKQAYRRAGGLFGLPAAAGGVSLLGSN